MARTLTAADRKRLIKMASTMPVGSPERKAILKGLSKSAGLPKSPGDAWDTYVGSEGVSEFMDGEDDAEAAVAAYAKGHEFFSDLSKSDAEKVKGMLVKYIEQNHKKASGSKTAASVDALRRKVEDLFYDYGLNSYDDYEEYDGYSGRAMYGALSPLAFQVSDRYNGPQSDLGKDMKRMGFMADNLGMGWIYYLPASGRMAGFQAKGLKPSRKAAASEIPTLISANGREKVVMPANGTDFKLREVQKMVGGYVEVVYLRDGRIMLVDEEGLLKGLPLNRAASRMAGRPIVGEALVMPNDMFR